MKTLKTVFLALIFATVSTIGFAQVNSTWPESTVKINDHSRFNYDEPADDDDEDEDDVEYIDTTKNEELYPILERPFLNNAQNRRSGSITHLPYHNK